MPSGSRCCTRRCRKHAVSRRWRCRNTDMRRSYRPFAPSRRGPDWNCRHFSAMRAAGAEALIIVSAPEFNRDAEILAALAIEAKLPTVCEWSHMAAQGCLFGYGPSQTELRRRTADYLVRIFRGSAPG